MKDEQSWKWSSGKEPRSGGLTVNVSRRFPGRPKDMNEEVQVPVEVDQMAGDWCEQSITLTKHHSSTISPLPPCCPDPSVAWLERLEWRSLQGVITLSAFVGSLGTPWAIA